MIHKAGNSKFYVGPPITDGYEEKLKKESKEKLEQELSILKKRELYRQYTSFITMVPLAAFMAIELISECSGWALLSIISGALSHLIIPFVVLSLICTLYLIYNNRKIAQKEQELRELENGEIVGKEEKNVPYNIDDYFNCIDVTLTILVIVASIVGEALEQGIIEDVALLISNLFGFIASAAFCYNEYKKSEEYEAGKGEGNHSNNDEKSKKNTNTISPAKLMLAGSSVLLVKRIMLIALASSLNPVVGPVLGLVGMICLMAGQVLIMRSYITDVKVSEKGASLGLDGMNNMEGYNLEGPVLPNCCNIEMT